MGGEWQRHEVSQLMADGKLVIGDGYRAKNDELASSGLPFARAGNINDGFRFDDADHFPEENLTRVGNKISQPGDVVFTSKDTVGRFAFVRPTTPRFVYSPQLCFWRSLDHEGIYPRFLYYWMFGREFFVQFKGVAGQTDMAEYVSLTDQRRMYITLPPLPEQRAIAHILGTLDDKIELNRRMNETLEAMARALFKSWFIDFDPVRRNAARRRNQPSPPPPLPEVEGRKDGRKGFHYRGAYDFSEFAETARVLRKVQTPAEDLFWELVRDRRLLGLKFRRQHQMGDYIADFYCHEHHLVVELDGGIHSAKRKQDHKRDAWMQAQGITVLRFPNAEILDDPSAALHRIADTVSSASRPLPLGEGRGEGSVEFLDRLFPDRFEDSELGEIPKGWHVGALGDVATNPRRGVHPSEIDPSTPCIALEHMPKRCITLTGWGTANDLQSNKFEFKKGEILFGKLRPYFHKVGVAPLDGVCSTDIVVVTPRTEEWSGFVLGHTSSAAFVEYTNASSTGTKMPRTSWGEMARYAVVMPPEAVAEGFTKETRPAVDRIIASIHESRTLAALRDALLPKLISGELRVKELDKTAVTT